MKTLIVLILIIAIIVLIKRDKKRKKTDLSSIDSHSDNSTPEWQSKYISSQDGSMKSYKIADINQYAEPKAEKTFKFTGLVNQTFRFPGVIKTILFIRCGFVQASKRGRKDFHEVVARLYQSEYPRCQNENHVGKLYIRVYDEPAGLRFETRVESLKWKPDGTCEVIPIR